MTAWPTYAQHPDGGYDVVCADHELDRHVDDEAHARNLLALHLRKDHPSSPRAVETFAIADAASFVVIMDADHLMSTTAKDASLAVFALLVGMPKPDALAYAHAINATNLRAAPLPF